MKDQPMLQKVEQERQELHQLLQCVLADFRAKNFVTLPTIKEIIKKIEGEDKIKNLEQHNRELQEIINQLVTLYEESGPENRNIHRESSDYERGYFAGQDGLRYQMKEILRKRRV